MCASLFPASGNFIFTFTFYSAYVWLRWVFTAFSSCGAWGPHCGGFSCGAHALGTWVSAAAACGPQSADSAVVAHGLSFPPARGIFLGQGLNPCPLPWQADSYPLHHQQSLPGNFFLSTVLHVKTKSVLFFFFSHLFIFAFISNILGGGS